MTPVAAPDAPPGPALAAQGFWDALKRRPYAFDLFFALRVLQARHPGLPRLGRAARPQSEPLRLGQDPSLAFAPATIAEVLPATAGQPERMTVWSFGLYGPNGPLPTHMTEYVRERLRQHDDATLARFSDIFHHRLLLLFFRAWSDAQPTTALDRPSDDPFGRWLRSLVGLGEDTQCARDQVADAAKLALSGHLTRSTRNPEGLCAALALYFEAPVALQEYCLHHLALEPAQQTRLTRQPCNSALGVDTVLGARVPDAQSKFRLRIGPLPRAAYERFLPGGANARALLDWVRNYLGIEYAWDFDLVLQRQQVPACQLGGDTRLGWTSWLLSGPARSDASDLRQDPEARLRARGQRVRGDAPQPATSSPST
ncbi:type VI secretion system baseplate subunit TssG [Pseudorhodoferax sp.]|uniref:type VI secretion system baseplate subunit TssG n=1 Tax=Pseudorhodoferax sp. TaxID=1993553 RepID=UPI002DD65E27|nr:type VI secretion system baseplate subunit TssG [Pseudorhodoferax sp.]